jgi:multidrug efflux system membrane fusion protein
MKRWWKWIAVAVVLLLVAVLAGRALSVRKAQQQALAQASAKTAAVVELATTDVTRAQVRELEQGLPVTGALKAVTTAFVKARVAGELQGLTVREGDAVKAGQVVARIEPTEYQARLRQAQDQANAAKVQIDIAQRQFDNNRALMEKGFISKTALDTSAFNLSGAQASYQAALAAADVARKTLADTVLVAPINRPGLAAAGPARRAGAGRRADHRDRGPQPRRTGGRHQRQRRAARARSGRTPS